MNFIDDDGLQVLEEDASVFRCDQQAKLFRRRQQHVRGVRTLALALVWRRVSGTRFDAKAQIHLAQRSFEIARDVGSQSL